MNKEETILKLINDSAEKFGRINLSSGNCGQFSIAIAQKLSDLGIESTIGVLYRYDEEVNDIDDLAGQELPIYHITLSIGDDIFDSTGKITTNDLINFSIREYNDTSPAYIQHVDIDDLSLHTIIDFETDWSISKEIFYDFLNDKEKPKNSKKLKP